MAENPSIFSSLAKHWEYARTLRNLQIHFDPEKCTGAWECYEVCPVNCWMPDHDRRKAIVHDLKSCIACEACVLQCPEDAIRLK